jgi:hypothetical protein
MFTRDHIANTGKPVAEGKDNKSTPKKEKTYDELRGEIMDGKISEKKFKDELENNKSLTSKQKTLLRAKMNAEYN